MIEAQHGSARLVVRHEEVVLVVEFLQRDVAQAEFPRFFILCFCHFAVLSR